MRSLDAYIFKQCASPLVLILAVTTAIVWMTQTLQRIDIMVEYGQGFGVFALISILIIPSLLAVIIPFALFGAAVYALYRLHSDSEVAVMFAAGVSRWRIAAPILLVAFLGALGSLYVNADLMPRGYRQMKRIVADVRADFATALVRSGEFVNVSDDFTVYVDDAGSGGLFVGLLINDHRNPSDPRTYMAERAVLRDTQNGPVLFLKRGNIQTIDKDTGEVNLVRFEDWAINIGSFNDGAGELQLEFTERYLGELFNPDMSKPFDRANVRKLKAEGHARLASPLLVFANVMIALYAVIGGVYSRRGYALRIAIAAGAVFVTRVAAFVAQGFVETTGAYWLLYATPLAVIVAISAALFRPLRAPRNAAGAV